MLTSLIDGALYQYNGTSITPGTHTNWETLKFKYAPQVHDKFPSDPSGTFMFTIVDSGRTNFRAGEIMVCRLNEIRRVSPEFM